MLSDKRKKTLLQHYARQLLVFSSAFEQIFDNRFTRLNGQLCQGRLNGPDVRERSADRIRDRLTLPQQARITAL